jgi:cytochrome b involved in lipid metabolism
VFKSIAIINTNIMTDAIILPSTLFRNEKLNQQEHQQEHQHQRNDRRRGKEETIDSLPELTNDPTLSQSTQEDDANRNNNFRLLCLHCKRHQQTIKPKRRRTTKQLQPITKCQLSQHNTLQSAWLLCGTTIYDATFYIQHHPGGVNSILRKSGGVVDCTRDLKFHTVKAVRMWKELEIGYLVPCNGSNSGSVYENGGLEEEGEGDVYDCCSSNERCGIEQQEQCIIS